MPDYTLAPTETLIREAHLYAQIPSLLSIAGDTPALLRNDGPTPITVTPYAHPPLTDPTPRDAGSLLRDPTPTTLPSGGSTVLVPDTYAVVSNSNGRFTLTRI
jgi:hypothetical protein